MNIGMLLNGNYPKDIRVRKEAETLSKYHSVFILCKKEPTDKSFEVINGVTIVRQIRYMNTIHEGIIDVLASIKFIHPYFKNKLPKFILDHSIDTLHVHDLPLAKTAILAANKYKLKSVLDLHENYPAALKTWFSWRKSPIVRLKNKIFFNYNRWRDYEAKIIKKYDVLIAVVSEMKQRLIDQHKIDPKKIVIVPNAEKKEFADNFNNNPSDYFIEEKGKFIISYVGGFGPHRGLHTAIKGMIKVSKEIPNALLVLVGPSSSDVRTHLQSIIIKNKLEPFVKIKGAEPFENVVKIMKNSNINIIPHISNEHTESAVPHKFFQILLSSKPLLVSDCAPMKRLIEAHDIGTYFESENSRSFAEKISYIHRNYKETLLKANKGLNLSLHANLNWDSLSKNLIKLYDNLEN